MTKRVPILLYHVIGEAAEGTPEAFYAVTRAAFSEQMRYLAQRGCHTVSLEALADWVEGRGSLPPRAVAITFDDGDVTQHEAAVPILQEHGFQAMFFVTAARVGEPGMMGWDDVRRVEAAGMAIGSHGLTHRLLTELTVDEVRWELAESKRLLETHVMRPVQWFAFPGGAWSSGMPPLVAEAGYRGAVTSDVGYVARGVADRWWPRCVMRSTDNVSRLAELLDAPAWFLWRERMGQQALRAARSVLGMQRYEALKRRLVRRSHA